MLFNIVHGITGLTLPTNLTSMGVYCFSDCTELTGELFLPDGLEKVNDYAFNNCKLQQLTFTSNSKITSFNDYCFYYNSLSWIGYTTTIDRINTVSTLPPKTQSTGYMSFSQIQTLENLSLPNTIVTIGDWTFGQCRSLNIVSWSSSLQTVGWRAFINTAITSLPTGDSLKEFGDCAFESCTQISAMNIIDYLKESTIEVLSVSPFASCTQFTGSYDGTIINKNGKSITISNTAFLNTSVTKDMTIPNNITSISDSAYAGTTSLTNTFVDKDENIVLEIPSTVTSIGEAAFQGSTAFTKVIIPSSVTSIGKSVFFQCTRLEIIEFESGSSITILPENFANACIMLTNCILPEKLEKISTKALFGLSSLETINLPDTLIIIDDNAFGWDTNLKSIIIPSQVTSIGDRAFYRTALAIINIPNSVESIGELAFAYSYSVNSVTVTLGTGITSISDSCFDSIAGSNYKGIGSITCNGNITSIGSKAFYGQINLTSINGITWSNLKSIGSSAFENCTSLSGSISLSSTCSVGDNAFENCLLSVGRINK
jgi:hypothetical protein